MLLTYGPPPPPLRQKNTAICRSDAFSTIAMDIDATSVAEKILRHQRFKDLVAQTAHGQAPQSQRRARTVYDSSEAELASVWRGRTVTATTEKKSAKKTSGKGRRGSSRLGRPAQGTFKTLCYCRLRNAVQCQPKKTS